MEGVGLKLIPLVVRRLLGLAFKHVFGPIAGTSWIHS